MIHEKYYEELEKQNEYLKRKNEKAPFYRHDFNVVSDCVRRFKELKTK